MDNTVTNKIKHFPQSLALGTNSLKGKWHYIIFWSIITVKVDEYAYKYKDEYICKDLLQTICLVLINTWLNFLLKNFSIKLQLFCSPCWGAKG